jgi:hypothetical protein
MGGLRKVGQFLGLIYRDDGTWQLGRGRRREPPPLSSSGSDLRDVKGRTQRAASKQRSRKSGK